MQKQNLPQSVILSDGKVEKLSDLINILLEYGVFFRWIYFKNRPRGNLLFLRALFVVASLGTIFFLFFHDFRLVLMGIDINPVIAFGAATAFGYWNMSSVFHNKSATCTQLYTTILSAKAQGDSKKVQLLSTNFALNLLTMDMWAHRLYDGFFSRMLETAMIHHFQHGEWAALNPQATVETKNAAQGAAFQKVCSGDLQAREARHYLNEYLEYLWQTT